MGNPGVRYAGNRHNVGFRAVDLLAARLDASFRKPLLGRFALAEARAGPHRLSLVKPLTFMNRSGEVLPAVLRRTGADAGRLLVICDTLDLPPGACRLKRRGGAGGHKGLASIIDHLGTGEFLRCYLGVGHPGGREEVVGYVLSDPPRRELEVIEQAVRVASEAVLRLLEEEPEKVMNEVNRRAAPAD